jgi:hypothetical protein
MEAKSLLFLDVFHLSLVLFHPPTKTRPTTRRRSQKEIGFSVERFYEEFFSEKRIDKSDKDNLKVSLQR